MKGEGCQTFSPAIFVYLDQLGMSGCLDRDEGLDYVILQREQLEDFRLMENGEETMNASYN